MGLKYFQKILLLNFRYKLYRIISVFNVDLFFKSQKVIEKIFSTLQRKEKSSLFE